MGKNWKFKDLSNQKFNKLLVIGLSHKKGKHYYWNCLCDCGKNKVISGSELTSGGTKSCGCLKIELRKESAQLGDLNHHPLYFIYNGIKARCFNEDNHAYKRYGGRGITMCEEWKNDFIAFYNWCLANGWNKGLHIDREINDGNYEPSNCRFITPKKNNFNKRNTLVFDYNGQQLTALDLEDISGIPAKIIASRIHENNWPVEKAITMPYMKGRRPKC